MISKLDQGRWSIHEDRLPQRLCKVAYLLVPMTIAFLCMVSPALAQEHLVTGVITDEMSGDPLPGTTIVIEGTTLGTVTNINGEYTLPVPSANDTLRISFVGYETMVVPIDGRNEINIALSSITLTSGEVVVVGYRVQQRQDLTGSVEVVDTKRLAELPSGQLERQLQGQASGVTIINNGQPGDDININIRGFNTFGNNAPLYVVDGVPTQNIRDINPNDIESLQVLKDAGAASIYGARASNGVVVITTRRGRGGVTISYDAQAGIQTPRSNNVWEILSPQEMADLKWMALANSNTPAHTDLQYGPFGPGTKPRLPDYILPAGAMEGEVDEGTYYVDPHYTSPEALNTFNQIVRANKLGTDWYDEITNTAPMIQNNITVSGGGELGQFLFSLGHLNHQGVVDRTYLKRYSARANTMFNIKKNLRVGENLSFSVSSRPRVDELTEGSAIGMSYRNQPIIPVYDIAGNFAGSAGSGMGNAHNPVAQLDRTRNNQSEDRRLFGNIFVEYDLFDNVMLRSSMGGELWSSAWNWFTFPTYERSENTSTNTYGEGSNSGTNWTWTTTLNSRHEFKGHRIEFVAGTEAYRNYGRQIEGQAQGYFSFNPDYTNLGTASSPQPGNSWKWEDAILSLIGRADYSFRDKYLLSFTIRRDGSSRFVDDQWGTFPGFSAGWRVSQEPFMRGINWLTDLKLRGGFGVMGNQLNVNAANAFTLYVGQADQSFYDISGSNGSVVQGFRQSRIGNPAAVWERTEDFNVGADIALFGGQLEATVDYYQKNVKDLLYTVELPGTAGAASPPAQNVASMANSGIDLSIRHGAMIGDLRLNSRLTFTSYNNEIKGIAEGLEYFDDDARRFGTAIVRNAVGQPMSSYYGYDIIGFWQSQDEIDALDAQARQIKDDPEAFYQQEAKTGRFRYRDVDGNGYIDADDRTFLGDPNPDFTYGINFNAAYRAFDVNLFFYGVQGNQIWNQVRWWTDFYSSFQGAKSKTALYDSWTPDNPNARVSIVENEQTFSTNNVPNSYYVEDGSYLRLKSFQLGYTLPARLTRQIGMSYLRLYVQANDIFTITGYTGIDPEIGGNVVSYGIDEGAYATPASYTIGVNLTL